MINYQVLKKPTQMLIKKKPPNLVVRSTLQIDPPLIKLPKFILVATDSMGCDHHTLNEQKHFDH